MLKIIFGFLPWILYSLVLTLLPHQHVLAISSALVSTLVLDFHELKKGFILPWGTLVFFLCLLTATFFISNHWLELHANIISNCALALIVWVSLLINKPFTLQYAREQVPPEFWNTPLFLRINQIITFVWAMVFLLTVVCNAIGMYDTGWMQQVYQNLPYALLFFAIAFTNRFPDWYKQSPNADGDVFDALIKYDVKTGQSWVRNFGPQCTVGEVVFAPKLNMQTEDDGYLMLFVYDKQVDKSNFIILDARELNAPILASIKLPRIPYGLHGSWFAD